MLSISPQISDASVQERIQPENAESVKKSGLKNDRADRTGVFGRLLAGLLRKTQTARPEETGDPDPSEARAVKDEKKKKPVLAGFRALAAPEKQHTEEAVVTRKSSKPEKSAKKTEEGFPLEAAADAVKPASVTAAPDTGDVPEEAPENGPREIRKTAEEETVSGLSDKKPEKTDAGFSLSPERPEVFPGFSEKIREQTEGREEAKSAGGTRNRRKDRIAVEVRDQRTQVSREVSPDLRVQELSRGAERELTVELRPAGERTFAGTGPEAEAPAAGETGGFAKLLAEQLAGDLSPNIVKQAAVVLRDGGEGTIRLSLKPETLGKVKIHLEMAENKISGHIFVESEEALRAFEKEIHSLEQAFRDSGFSDASLDLSGNGGEWKERETTIPFFSERFAASSYDSAPEIRSFSGPSEGGFSTVNLLV
ncbi:MAG: flagellar hook-length control protein FliK [Treponema sp.]|jgi:flagellar hook-length control protein FliK|nr:flagellar hook-length control protein FliK [Treponema sp.]